MIQPSKSGRELLEEIGRTITATPTLWWLGHSGFIVRFATITFYIDPCLSELPGRRRFISPPLCGADVDNADMIFATHAHAGHLDAATLVPMVAASKQAKLVLPKSAAEAAHAAGVPYERMTTTDADLRIEYFKDDLYGRVYAVPSAHPQLDWTPAAGYPYLGYLIRFGRWSRCPVNALSIPVVTLIRLPDRALRMPVKRQREASTPITPLPASAVS